MSPRQAAGLSLARRLQAAAARRPVPLPEARRRGRRPRRRPWRLDPGGRRAAPAPDARGNGDRHRPHAPMEPIPGATVLAKDFHDDDAPAVLTEALGGPADVVLSDMAASATGHARPIICASWRWPRRPTPLPPGAEARRHLRCQGPARRRRRALLDRLKQDFAEVRHVKPAASRADLRRSTSSPLASGAPARRGDLGRTSISLARRLAQSCASGPCRPWLGRACV